MVFARTTLLAAARTSAPTSSTFRIYLRAMSSSSSERLVLSSRSPSNQVVVLTLNRPKALNALSTPLFDQLNEEMEKADADPTCRAIVLTGIEKAFAAGADIKEMKDKTFSDAYGKNFLGTWTKLAEVRKPIIGAVSGFALGGGMELAMSLDILICNSKAVFGQPEITLGIIPGAGGSQRLTRLIGKPRAMDMVLTGRKVDGKTAEAWGIVSRCVSDDQNVVEEAVKIAETIAGFGGIAVQAGKEAVNASQELPLAQGLRLERRLFQGLFATQDQKEGMAAFAEKRKPSWKDQ